MLTVISALASTLLDPGDLVIVKATDTQLYRYQPSTGAVSPIATVGTFANDVALGDGPDAGKAWVASYVPQQIQAVDLATGTVTPFASGLGYLGLAYHEGRLYATILDNSVLVYDPGTGALLNTYSDPGASQFLGIRYDALNNRMVLSDWGQGAIYAMTLSGTFSTLASGWGSESDMYHIAIESNGNILVSGYTSNYVQRVNIHTGNTVSTVASGLPLSDPVGVAVDATGQIYAANFGDGNLVRMNADGTAMVNLGSIGADGGKLYSVVVVPSTLAVNGFAFTLGEDSALDVPAPGVLANDSDPDQGSMVTFTFEGRVLMADADFSAGERFVGFYTFDPTVTGVDHPDPSPSLNRQYDSPNGAWEIHFPDLGYRFTGNLISIGVGNDTDFGDRYIATFIGSASIGVPLPSGRQLNFAQLDLQDQVSGDADLLSDESIQTTTVSLALAQIVGGRLNFEGNSNAFLTFDQLTGPLSVSQVNGQAASVHQAITLASGATLRVNGNGSFTYDPRSYFDYLPTGATATDSFTYEVSGPDGGKATATVTITVVGVNDAPILQAIPDTEVVYGQFFQIPISGTDIDAAENEITLGVGSLGVFPLGVGYRLNRPTGTEFTAEIFGPARQTGSLRLDVTVIDCCVGTHTLFNLTVRRAIPTLSLSVADAIYNGQPHLAAASAHGVFGEELGPVFITYNGSPEAPIAPGTYTAAASFPGDENYEPASIESTYIIWPLPAIINLSPNTNTAGSSDFTLTIFGTDFANGAKVYWNGTERPTTFVSDTQLMAEISASDVTGGTEIMTVFVTVRNPNGGLSNPQSFAITPANVSAVQTTAAAAGQVASVSTAPTTAGEPGVTATVNNTGGDPVSVTVANYSSNPSGTAFSAGGGFTDVQITGADSEDVATVHFYYPSTIDSATEVALALVYFNGSAWVPVRSDGDADPIKNTGNSLDGTISGGRFTVVFSSTSTPMITELSGTIFAVGAPDTIPPTLACPNVTVPCGVDLLVPVFYSAPTVNDNQDPAPAVHYSIPTGSAFPIGTTPVTCTATDASGNSTTTTFTVTREALSFTGFLSPVGGADATGGSAASPIRTFKLGSTIPVKFTVTCGGEPILTGAHTLQAIKYSAATTSGTPIDATPQDSATQGNQFRLTNGQWHFNFDTNGTGMSIGIWQLIATLSDGSTHSVWVQLK